MTKYDIKLRRDALTKGQIERHKNFKSLSKKVYIERKSYAWIKLLAVIVAITLVISMGVLGYLRLSKEKSPRENPDMEIFEEFKSE